MVLGALGFILLAHGLAVYHPLRNALADYSRMMSKFWFKGTLASHWLIKSIGVGVVIGALYYFGVLANATSYWVIEPVRLRILENVYGQTVDEKNTGASAVTGRGWQAAEVSIRDTIILPAAHIFPKSMQMLTASGKTNDRYLHDEAVLGQKEPGRLQAMLDNELLFIRLLRGTAMVASLIAAISLLKLTTVLIWSPLWKRGGKMYERLIDEHSAFFENVHSKPSHPLHRASAIKTRLAIGFSAVVFPQFILIGLGLAVYVFSMIAYRTTEFEYVHLVRDGAAVIEQAEAAKSAPVKPDKPG